MTDVLFYHLERASLEDVLPGLLEKSLARGWRAGIRTGSAERVERLDAHLWAYRDDSFLPHGTGGDKSAYAERQPILITDAENLPNDPQILFLVDNADATAQALKAYERCVVIFDGRDEDAVSDARQFWKAVKNEGLAATYWKQSPQGRWEKQG